MIQRPEITVIGAGHGGRAFAAYLASKQYPVNLCFKTLGHIARIKKEKRIYASGAIEGSFKLKTVVADWEKAIRRSTIILVVLPADHHDEVIELIAAWLRNGQILLLNPGRTWGAINARSIITRMNPQVRVHVGETETLLFTCRKEGDTGVTILKVKDKVDYCFYPESSNVKVGGIIETLFPQLHIVNDIRITSLNNIGAVLHPATAVLNAGSIGRKWEFLFYRQGITEDIVKVLEQIDAERCAVMEKMGVPIMTFLDWAKEKYGVAENTFHGTFQKIDAYAAIKSPESLENRYISEDIPTGLVPIASLGSYYRVPTPHIDAVIQLCSTIAGKDFMKEGRTIENVGVPQSILEPTAWQGRCDQRQGPESWDVFNYLAD